MSDGLAAVVHFCLAWKYREISRRIPNTIDKKPLEEETTCERVFYWVMLTLNVVSGPCRSVASAVFRTINMIKHKKPGRFLKIMIPISFDLPGFCSIVSGIILVCSVMKIRRFFKKRNDEEYIDLRALCRHASCFVFYLVGAIIFYTAYNIYTFSPTT
jgi:hypothetical protein